MCNYCADSLIHFFFQLSWLSQSTVVSNRPREKLARFQETKARSNPRVAATRCLTFLGVTFYFLACFLVKNRLTPFHTISKLTTQISMDFHFFDRVKDICMLNKLKRNQKLFSQFLLLSPQTLPKTADLFFSPLFSHSTFDWNARDNWIDYNYLIIRISLIIEAQIWT